MKTANRNSRLCHIRNQLLANSKFNQGHEKINRYERNKQTEQEEKRHILGPFII